MNATITSLFPGLAALLLAAGCDPGAADTSPPPRDTGVQDTAGPDTGDDQPVDTGREVECDADGDGHLAEACGGDDCDDGDPGVHPLAAEVLGDGIDQDCDGDPDLRYDQVSVPPGLAPLGWRWRSDLRALGGVVITETGAIAGHTLYFEPAFPAALDSQHRDTYGELDPMLGVPLRAWDGDQALDVLATVRGDREALQGWSGEDRAFAWEASGTGLGGLDGRIRYGEVELLACGDGSLRVLRWAGGDTLDVAAERSSEADSCVLLAPGERTLALAVDLDQAALLRWEVSGDGFTDYLRLAEGVRPEQLASVSTGDDAFFAFTEGDRVTLLRYDGRGMSLGQRSGDPGRALALDADGAGTVAMAWSDAGGVVRLAAGRFPDDVETWVLDVPGAGVDLAVGTDGEELAVSVFDGEDLVIARAVLP